MGRRRPRRPGPRPPPSATTAGAIATTRAEPRTDRSPRRARPGRRWRRHRIGRDRPGPPWSRARAMPPGVHQQQRRRSTRRRRSRRSYVAHRSRTHWPGSAAPRTRSRPRTMPRLVRSWLLLAATAPCRPRSSKTWSGPPTGGAGCATWPCRSWATTPSRSAAAWATTARSWPSTFRRSPSAKPIPTDWPSCTIASTITSGSRVRPLLVPIVEAAEHSAVVSFNVLEHIEDDVGALASFAGLVRPGGAIVVLTPACPFAMSPFDREIGHLRRYSRRSLVAAGRGGRTDRRGGPPCQRPRPAGVDRGHEVPGSAARPPRRRRGSGTPGSSR